MTTYVHIENMRIHAFHGVFPEEHKEGADYIINVRVGYDWQKAIETDDLSDTISYADIAEIIKEEMLIESKLVEHVAGRILKHITAKFPQTESVNLKITKLDPPMPYDCNGAGCELLWSNVE